jgi:MFS family permease
MADGERLIPVHTEVAVYGAGVFSNSMAMMANVVLPLWVLTFDPGALLIGVLLACRHVLPTLLSIHGGAMMDRLGTRRVMLIFAAIGAIVPLLFPALPFLAAVAVLQAMAGLTTSMGWIGAQTLIGRIMKGSPVHAGRLSFSLRFGHLVAPIAGGAAWDHFGPWGAFSVMSLWGAFGFAFCLMLPRGRTAPDSVPRAPVTASDLIPRWSDYVAAFKLMALPAVMLVVGVTMLRIAGNGIQSSFYIVYLEGIGITGTQIGLLLSSAAILGAVGALAIGPMLKFISARRLLLLAVAGSVGLIAITPLLGLFALLVPVAMLRGATLGISQPLMISTLAQAVDRTAQGKAVGLRNTVNRVVSMSVPLLMGVVVEFAGLEAAFYIVGVVVLVLIGMLWVWAERHPELNP